ncbi:MAG: glycoside hydrolase family 127 protein [Candidatus Omnitrophica bacterium]|nr:glycoside hydrolase family 127 protein [Candidatus Omnitrophota bacterium]
MLLQFFRSGNLKWFDLANNLAKHVADIDIYHTNKDKVAYNGGMFWHTFHYTDAATSTHRSYSKLGSKKMNEFSYGIGGGPANEHNYATGLVHHYFLTGDSLSKEAVISLADWVINMDDGSKSVLKFLNHKPTGKASQSASVYYHGPGRGSGNSINVLMDGYEITKNKKYLLKTEELIRRCVHPRKNIAEDNLEDVEHRWFYLVFLQALGRYLDLKFEIGERDYMFYYAKESLLHYAQWMLKNEVPYKDVLHKVDIPTETWPAHDIRKSNVFDFASKYSEGELSKKFKEKSEYFFNRCIDDLNTFKTKAFLRPLAIIMNFSIMHSYFQNNDIKAEFEEKNFDFGRPKKFKFQGYYLYKLRDFINTLRTRK